jgi:hypothetical protein
VVAVREPAPGSENVITENAAQRSETAEGLERTSLRVRGAAQQSEEGPLNRKSPEAGPRRKGKRIERGRGQLNLNRKDPSPDEPEIRQFPAVEVMIKAQQDPELKF